MAISEAVRAEIAFHYTDKAWKMEVVNSSMDDIYEHYTNIEEHMRNIASVCSSLISYKIAFLFMFTG